ncbi:MAG TPA: 3-oxoacyl-ACP reductase FabG [bacterium]|nr:3-oxoacyl-ACP reductase FabG [bacterium]
MQNDKGLQGKAALVTGGSQGIGKAICLELASYGCNIVINHYPTPQMEQDARSLAEQISKMGCKAMTFGADVTKKDQTEAMMTKVKELFGGLDILVNNAGILRDRTLQKMTDEEWYSIIDVNLNAAYVCCKAALPVLRDGSCIIGMSSIAGVYGNFGQSNYAASKAGLVGFYKSLAKELGHTRKIRVNAIAPGLVESPMSEQIPANAQQVIKEKTPLGRLGKSEDIAKAIRFLASADAEFITGHILHVDGGLTF